jgi:2-oxoisovalerate dehydrogenase E2 component (dihydrolipoyl transacylase)
MSTQNFNLPDVGEGLTEAEVVTWKVAPGDTVAINDVICEIETAKSLVELPSPHAGVVGELLVGEGTTVEVGTPIITFVTDARDDAGAGVVVTAEAPAPEEGGGSVLVGYGTGGGATSRRKRPAERQVRSSVGVIAKPPIRKLARDLGVDLTTVAPTGADGEVTRDDVMKLASQASVFRNIETPEWGAVREETVPAPQSAPVGLARGLAPTPVSSGDDSRTESIPVKGVRKATSSAMVQSAYSAPHVTVWKEIDASRTMELVKRLKASPDYADIRVSPLLIMARAVIWAARRTPMVNAAWIETEGGAEIAVRHYVNLGIAAATPRGLLVPNI